MHLARACRESRRATLDHLSLCPVQLQASTIVSIWPERSQSTCHTSFSRTHFSMYHRTCTACFLSTGSHSLLGPFRVSFSAVSMQRDGEVALCETKSTQPRCWCIMCYTLVPISSPRLRDTFNLSLRSAHPSDESNRVQHPRKTLCTYERTIL
jgi:hypothetical protein